MENNIDLTKLKKAYEELYSLNVNDKIEKKNGLSYLSWAYAFGEVQKRFPDFTYEVFKDELNRPYIYDENLGYMVFTKVTLCGKTSEMWLPVMDNANKTMKTVPYKYKVKEYRNGKFTGNYVEKICEAATMFDINRSIMRCLVKNIATACGLGLYIYKSEDIPEDITTPICADCGNEITAYGNFTAAAFANGSMKKYGRPLCKNCCDKQKEVK